MENKDHNPIVSYEILNSDGEYVTAYSADLKKNTNGRLDPLKMAKEALKHNPTFTLMLIYSNGHTELFTE